MVPLVSPKNMACCVRSPLSLTLLLTAAVLLSPALTAEETTAKENAAPGAKENAPAATGDFSAALQQIAALGVPDLREARWVNDREHLIMQAAGFLDGFERGRVWSESETAQRRFWLIKDGREGAPEVMLLGGARALTMVVDITANARRWGVPEEQMERFLKMQTEHLEKLLKQVQELPAADVAADVAALIGEIEKAAEKIKKEDGEFSRKWEHERRIPVNGSLLLFAAQLYQHGDSGQANRLASALFQHFPDRAAILSAAISQLADAQYRTATDVLAESGDWTGYVTALEGLTKKFARGWGNLPAVEKVLELAKRRATNAPVPSLAALEGAELDAATVAALDGLLKKQQVGAAKETEPPVPDLWVLPAPQKKTEGIQERLMRQMVYSSSEGKLPSEIARALTRSGMAALPTLAAAVGDETLVMVMNGKDEFSFGYSSDESAAEKNRRLFENLYRPITRGEIALRLLLPVLPGEEYKLRRLSAEALAEQAVEFWEEHRDATLSELAVFYLENGSDRQKRQMMDYVAASDDPQLVAFFEKQMLEGPDPEGMVEQSLSYVRAKQGAAKPFGRKLLERLKARLADQTIGRPKGEYSSRRSNNVTILSQSELARHIERLETMVSEEAPEKRMLDLLAAEGKSVEEKIQAAMEVVRLLPQSAQVPALAVTAAKTKDVELKVHLVGGMLQMGYMAEYMDAEEKEKTSPLVADSATGQAWRILLQDSATLDDVPQAMMFVLPKGTLLSELSGMAFALNYDQPPKFLLLLGQLKGLEVMAQMRDRALAILEGKTPPAWPAPEKVSQARFAEMVAEAAKTPFRELPGWLQGLPREEQMAWVLWIRQQGMPEVAEQFEFKLRDEPFPPALDQKTRNFAGLSADYLVASAEDTAFLKKALAPLPQGEAIDAARVEALAEQLLRNAEETAGTALRFFPSATTGIGWEVAGRRVLPAEMAGVYRQRVRSYDSFLGMVRFSAEQLPEQGDAAVMLEWRGQERGRMIWVRENGAAKKITEEPMPEWSPLKANQFTLVVLSTEYVQKLKAAEEMEDEE